MAADWHLAQIINAEFGAVIVTPWTVGRLPLDDVDEIKYWLDVKQRLAEGRKEQ